MTNCKYLQILVTNQDDTTIIYTFKQNYPHINCIKNSSNKYIDTTGQILDSSKLTTIMEHAAHDAQGTHMYVADETHTCVGAKVTATKLAPNNDCKSLYIGPNEQCNQYYTTKDSSDSFLCSEGGGGQCEDPTSMGAACPPDCVKTFKCTIK